MSNKLASNITIFCLTYFAIVSTLGILQGDTFISNLLLQQINRVLCYAIILVELIIFGWMFIKQKNNIHQQVIDALWITVPIIIFTFIRLVDTYPGYTPPLDLLNTLILFIIAIASSHERQQVFVGFKWFMVIGSILGLVAYCSYFLDWGIPFEVGDYYQNADWGCKYIKCHLGYLCLEINSIRLCSWFNEPGYFGTMLALVLAADKCNLRKWDNMILFIAGICSLSLAFLIIFILALIINNTNRPQLIFSIAVACLIFIFVFIPNMATGNSPLDIYLNRSNIQGFNLQGDNRTSLLFDKVFTDFLHTPSNWLFGLGSGSADNFGNVLSIKKSIYMYGFLGCLLIYGSLLLSALHATKKNWPALVLTACFFLSIYQRPSVFTAAYFILLFGGIEYIHGQKKQRNNFLSKKKVMIILPDLSCGGAERVTLCLSRQLRALGYHVLLVNCGVNQGAFLSWLTNDESIISLNKKHTVLAYRSLSKLIQKEQPDFVFTSRQHTAILVLIINLFNQTFKSVIRIPTMPSNKLYKGINGMKENIMQFIESVLLSKAYCVIAQTEEMNSEIQKRYNVNSSQIVTLRNPIDTNNIDNLTRNASSPYQSHHPIFVAVGNPSAAKAYDVLVHAFEIVHKNIPDAELHIVGNTETEYGQKLVQMTIEKPYIMLHGFQSNPYPFIQHSNVFVLPSRMEGFPNVVCEAMYLNKPVVTTQCVPVLSQLIQDGINGYTTPVDDPISLASAMQKALSLSPNNAKNNINNTNTLTTVFS